MEIMNDLNLPGLPRIDFGAGAFARLPDIIRSYGRCALVVIGGESLIQSGRWDALTRALHPTGLRFKAVSIRGEPTTDMIDGLVREYRKAAVEVVVAIGGGSVIDCGKAVAAMLSESGSVKDFLEGVGTKNPSGAKVPFVAVPTTAGTGSEATKNAVICDRKEGYKKSLRHDAYVPDAALVDPELTLGAPPHITMACGLDALSQLIEAYTSAKADLSIDALVLRALADASESLMPLALGRTNDVALRAKMSWAALVSGIALNRSGLGAVHGIAGPLGGLCPVPHGLACGKLLFPAMTFVVGKVLSGADDTARKRFADIGRIFSGKAHLEDVSGCRHFLESLRVQMQLLELPQLSRFGMTADIMERCIPLADSKSSPAVLSREEVKVILETIR